MELGLAEKLLLGAAFAQIALTLALLIRMGVLRVRAVQNRSVRLSEVALSSDKYPDMARKAGRAYANQLELPVLFYFAVALSLVLDRTGWLQASLASLFVALRYLHAYIHITSNNVVLRFNFFLAGVVVLSALLTSIFISTFFLGAS